MPNLIDLLLLLVIAASVWGGWRRGFIIGILDLLRWVVSFVAALFLYRPVSLWLSAVTGWTEVWTQPMAFIFVMIVTGILIQILGNRLLKRVPRETHDRRVNKALGIVPGLANGLITAAILSAFLLSIPLADGISEGARESLIADRLAGYTDEIETALVPIFDPAVRQTLNRLTTIEPGSSQSVELPFKVERTRTREDLEAEMLDLVNRERATEGLDPLVADPELAMVARAHSADMFARGYFSHYTPEQASPFDRMRAADVRFRTAGENLALAPTLQIAHRGLMNSPGHRANILRPEFGHLGIGILDGGRYGLMITQNFRN